mgnify:FL=1
MVEVCDFDPIIYEFKIHQQKSFGNVKAYWNFKFLVYYIAVTNCDDRRFKFNSNCLFFMLVLIDKLNSAIYVLFTQNN